MEGNILDAMRYVGAGLAMIGAAACSSRSRTCAPAVASVYAAMTAAMGLGAVAGGLFVGRERCEV